MWILINDMSKLNNLVNLWIFQTIFFCGIWYAEGIDGQARQNAEKGSDGLPAHQEAVPSR